IDGESKQLQKEEGANQGNRNGNGRNKGGAEILQEYKNNDKYQNKRFKDRILYLIDGLVDLVAYAVGDFIMDVFWKFTGKLFEYIPDTEIDFPCVGSAGLGDIQGKAGIAVHLVVAAQIGGSQFHPGYIPQVKNRSVVVGFDDNAFKLLLGGEPALVFENGFKCFIGGFPEFSRGHFKILVPDGADYILGDQVVGGKFLRVEPGTHCVIPPAHPGDSGHTIHPCQGPHDVDLGIGLQKGFVVNGIGMITKQVDGHDDSALARSNGDPRFVNLGGNPAGGFRNPGLHVHGGLVRIGSCLKEYVDGPRPGIAGRGPDIGHVVDPVDGFLNG